ncbi:MAG: UvrD-helicase domain-containing protein [Candidatus Peribacteria bacterium]|nr:MAG: UvrD-helicase domain-containing protein [Candidatus Peribacteria bacterium]
MKDQIDAKDARRVISNWKNSGWLPEQAGLHCESQLEERILKVYQAYQQELRTANALDFDDLLLLTKELFAKHPAVLAKWQDQFRHVLVDEAQDTNTIQFELIRQLVGTQAILTLIGDDYQSIYRRRGAVMENFLRVEQLWPSIKMFKLETNYRSLPHIVAAGNSIIQHNKRQYDKQLRAHRTGNQHIRIFEFADEIDEAAQIIELITKLKEEQQRSRNDFTVLYRTNAQSSPFEQILLTEGIPYQIV